MLNFNQRIEYYRNLNYFQINGDNLDLYQKRLPEWYQKIDVLKDLLVYASEQKLQNEYDILFIRVFGGNITADQERILKNNAYIINLQLAKELGASEYWRSIKLDSYVPDLHFASISISDFKYVKPKEIIIEKTQNTEQVDPTIQSQEEVKETDEQPKRRNRKQESADNGSI